MSLTRKDFLSAGALVAASAAALSRTALGDEAKPAKADAPPPPPPSKVHFPVLKQTEYEHKRVLDVLAVKKEHKLIFQAVEPIVIVPGMASLYVHVQNALNAGEFSFGWGRGNAAVSAVLMGPSVAFALNDAMWVKYNLGTMLKALDASGKPETSNVYAKAQTPLGTDGDPGAGGNVFQDWSAEACVKRGVTFMVCHNAMAGRAMKLAGALGVQPSDVLTEWKANLLPGFTVVPAGVGALQLAMEHGWKSLPIL